MKPNILRRKLPPSGGNTYIQPRKSAAILKGGAAFFISTGIYGFAENTNYKYILRNFSCAACFFEPRIFLFVWIEDKPIFSFIPVAYIEIPPDLQPRCRSPPTPFDFSHFKKSNGGKVNAKLEESQELQEI